ncbi:Acyl-CoA desaturase 1 [Neolecta irregularis DAH-3]|uniref:Acyl-CoA desaturase 1 n=1 Tax=Neolecta irregularis (strain DAH-3) TaxID=1198029 RepID=A0A1U7LMM1_NEOID|nr:Acyl-CoA desaturase 1 [Neolecta irregularis DAH-3]|eukprot:OLL23878.1 Acyl-CoA desaturase 1 [Neolecta irregularis DAH-3]
MEWSPSQIALIWSGEGYHNFHHTFPYDYRNGIKPLDWDPTKWIIWLLHTWTDQIPIIKKAKDEDILKARARVTLEKAHELYDQLYPQCEKIMPRFTKDEALHAFKDKHVLLLDSYIINVDGFASQHPGGEKLIVGYFGKDATKAFSLLNHHSSHAQSLVKERRIAKIVDLVEA